MYVKHAQTTFYVITTACLLRCTEPAALESGNSSTDLHLSDCVIITVARQSSLTRLSVRQLQPGARFTYCDLSRIRLVIFAHPQVWVHQ